jgi:hypothetical protein
VTSPGYVPPSAVGWFVKKQSVFLEVTAVPTAEAAFGDFATLDSLAVPTAAAKKSVGMSGVSMDATASLTSLAAVRKKIAFDASSGGAGGVISPTKSAWSYVLDWVHTPVGGSNMALIAAVTVGFKSYSGVNYLEHLTASYGGTPMSQLAIAWHNGDDSINNYASLTALFGLLIGSDAAPHTVEVSTAQDGTGYAASYTYVIGSAATYTNVSGFGYNTAAWAGSADMSVWTMAISNLTSNYLWVNAFGVRDPDPITAYNKNQRDSRQVDSAVSHVLGDTPALDGGAAIEFTASSGKLNAWSGLTAELVPVTS